MARSGVSLRKFRTHALCMGALLVSACVPDGPEAAARGWTEALFNHDRGQLSALTCNINRSTIDGLERTADRLVKASGLGARLDLDHAEFQTLRDDGRSADVRVSAEVHMAIGPIGHNQSLTLKLRMRRESDQWHVCDLSI